MFESILVRRTTPSGHKDQLDLGHLAETMLFYSKVRLVLTRWNVPQLIHQCGPSQALEIVTSTNVKAVRLDVTPAIQTVDPGTQRERYWPPVGVKVVSADQPVLVPADEDPSISVARLPDEAYIVKLFQEATGKSGRGRRMGNAFLEHTDYYNLPVDDLHQAVQADWADGKFMRQAAVTAVKELAPSYPVPSDLRIELEKEDDGYYVAKGNLDWAAALAASANRDNPLTATRFLTHIMNMRQGLYLAAHYEACIAQDTLGEGLTRAKCLDLTAALDDQQMKIAEFQTVVVRGVIDIREAINSGGHSFSDVLALLKEAEPLRKWFDKQEPDADIVKEYLKEANKKRILKSSVVKNLRWVIPHAVGMVPVATAFVSRVPEVAIAAPVADLALDAVDKHILARYCEGWRPAMFVDDKLRPFLSRQV
jgi:hypothetical protein